MENGYLTDATTSGKTFGKQEQLMLGLTVHENELQVLEEGMSSRVCF